MGDRANIRIKQQYDETGNATNLYIYLYSHWGGSDLPMVLQMALKKKWRWDDPSYLTRIIFCEMVKDDVAGETGYGIATSAPDNEHEYIDVDCEAQTVKIGDKHWTFKQYCEADLESLEY